MPPKPDPARDLAAPDDLTLWDLVTADVRPLARTRRVVLPPKTEPREPPTAKKPGRIATPAKVSPTPPAPLPPKPPPPFAGIDRRTLERFRAGAMAIDGRLDLHGLDFERAHAALDRFVERAQAGGKRCLLIITGKGGRDDGRKSGDSERDGGLRAKVPRWLAAGPHRARILTIAHAAAQHGGSGAYYVLLRRVRN